MQQKRKNIGIQITAGQGPAECCWVVAQVVKKLFIIAEEEGGTCKLIHKEPGEQHRTLQSALLQISTEQPETWKSWEGTVQWVGKSPFRKYHKRKNWFVSVKLVQPKAVQGWSEKDLKFQTFRASGPGGQHVNKTSSAVRLIHLPSQMSVTASESRSQHQNKKLALERFDSIYRQYQMKCLRSQANEQWHHHLNVERGNPIRVFKGRDFEQVFPE